jgi:hypothetical protein
LAQLPANEWTEELENKMKIKHPVILHVRGADYVSQKNSIGLLDQNYYRNALEKIPNSNAREIWVFTDDMNYARNLLKKVDYKFIYINQPNNISPLSILKVISRGSDFVLGNSTFAWWGAYFSRSAKRIVCPSPWFKALPSPQDLIPSNWLEVESSWVE